MVNNVKSKLMTGQAPRNQNLIPVWSQIDQMTKCGWKACQKWRDASVKIAERSWEGERWSVSSLFRKDKQTSQGNAVNYVWLIYIKWVSCTFLFEACTFWRRALNPILRRTKVLLIYSEKPQRAMSKHPDHQPARDPRHCKHSLKLCKQQDLNTQICSQQSGN